MKNTILTNRSPVTSRALSLLAAFTVLGLGGAAQAAVTINGSATFNGGIYTYTYSVTNMSTDTDLVQIDIPIGEGVVVSNLAAPGTFQIITDGPPINLVTFLGGNDPFAPETFGPGTTIEFFTFDSAIAPGVATYSVLDANGDMFTGETVSAIPEPSGLMLLAASAFPLIAIRRRRIR